MDNAKDRGTSTANEAKPAGPDQRAAAITSSVPAPAAPAATVAKPQSHLLRLLLILAAVAIGLVVGAYFLIPLAITMVTTVSTDDAYVNGHVTFVAPRVPGEVIKVLVDDNMRVKKGDVLVQLDKEPYQVQVAIKKAALTAAETDQVAAEAQVRGLMAQTRGNRFKLAHAIEDVKNQIANLGALVAAYDSKKATLDLAKANLKRGEELVGSGGVSKEDNDQRRQQVRVSEAAVEQALQAVYALRAGLGQPLKPPEGRGLADVEPDLDQNFSSVRQALADLLQSAAQLGIYPASYVATPKQIVDDFLKRDPEGDLDRIYAKILKEAPPIKQSAAKLLEAKADLDQAELNLRYCDVVSEIDGVVTRRNVNPGNNVQVGQNLMAVRSLTEIWIDANFKETQLGYLRIGQKVRCDVDMYGSKREYEGRITGFTMGTGQTLSLLPPQNATGNFVKIVQRLPVRIELTNYDPDKEPLFVGLSVTPYVYYNEKPEGANAGAYLQPLQTLPQAPPQPKP